MFIWYYVIFTFTGISEIPWTFSASLFRRLYSFCACLDIWWHSFSLSGWNTTQNVPRWLHFYSSVSRLSFNNNTNYIILNSIMWLRSLVFQKDSIKDCLCQGCAYGTLMNPMCQWCGCPTVRYIFTTIPVHLCAVKYMTEILFIVTLSKQISFFLVLFRTPKIYYYNGLI